MQITEHRAGRDWIIRDAACIEAGESQFYEASYWREREALVGSAAGRGSTHFFELHAERYALRHYRRGGLVRHLSRDLYLWTGLAATRAWREFEVLVQLRAFGLPAPVPVAARVQRSGPWYRADIVTRVIPDARTLAERLASAALDAANWQAIGATLRRFHIAGLNHADLNAHNVMLNAAGQVFLIDFDRARLCRPDEGWQGANLRRLRRSLDKLAGLQREFHFSEAGWQALLAGYRGVSA